MLRDLLTPEDHADPYIWAAVFAAHAWVGAALVIVLGDIHLALTGYLLFEVLQAVVSRRLIVLDSVLDWLAVVLGAAMIWTEAGRWIVALICVAIAAGWIWKRRHR
ncbi:hypothetical protein [Pontibaca methylaminivorans]|uniref:Uncharacterized protein n=1 Tax=Pontibaca methylaminivorans TaxID=515897 RepID=A0A1R3WBU0_9RHOB|nr:hypothetical protein [Pontibaca methylaminivorans]SIT74799.1 hypothetical protein SAMN05421849_0215 [Pontibaca methylaminivorans]